MLYGVFVGINRYVDNQINDLCYARADATRFHDLFCRSLDASDIELHLLVDERGQRKT